MMVAGTSVQILAELLTCDLKGVLSEAFWKDANVSERGSGTRAVPRHRYPTPRGRDAGPASSTQLNYVCVGD